MVVDTKELLALYEHFRAISSSRIDDGEVDFEEWLQALELRDSTFSRRIFDAFDEDGNGSISFREFVVGLSVFSPRSTIEEKLDLSFSLYDIDNDGAISKDELFAILKASMLENYSLSISDEHMRELVDATFEQADVNGDGLISYDEYKQMILNHPEILAQFSLNSDLLLDNAPAEHPPLSQCPTPSYHPPISPISPRSLQSLWKCW